MDDSLDILLISVGDVEEDDRREIPLGIAFLCGQLKREQFSYRVLDLYNLGNSNTSYEILKENIIKFRPKVIGISSSSYYLDLTKTTIKFIKEIYSKLGGSCYSLKPFIILGGYISLIPEVLKITDADVVCHSEGEITLIELLNYYLKRSHDLSLLDIKGISFKDEKGQITKTPSKKLIESLDTLEFPDFSQFNLSVYNTKEALPFYSQRGCVIGCSFCDIIPFYGQKIIRRMSPKRIMEWLDSSIKQYSIRRIDFMDDSFLNNRLFIEEFFDLLNKFFSGPSKTPQIKINFQARANEILRFQDILMKYKQFINCIEIGTESYAQTQLDRWNKNTTVLDNIKANEILSKSGIPYINFYLWFDDKTTLEELDENIERILDLPSVPLMGSNITIPHFVLNYEISAIHDLYGQSSVKKIPHLNASEQFLNDTNEQAKKLSTIYIGLKKLVEEPRVSLDIANLNQAKEISKALFPLAEDILKKRLFMAINIVEILVKNKINQKSKMDITLKSYLKEFNEMFARFIDPIKKLGFD